MRTSEINEQQYPFSWLDELIEITLNPDANNVKLILPEKLLQIREQLPIEINQVICCMKTQAFYLYVNEQIKIVAGHYDQAIRVLQIQARHNQERYPRSGPLAKTGQFILHALEHLSHSVYNRYSKYLPEPGHANPMESTSGTMGKFLFALSADQIGILIRAALDVKLILSSSMRKICQAIAPFLSTKWKEHISWDTIRSNAGRPESRDKDIAIQFLEKMIEKIRGYR